MIQLSDVVSFITNHWVILTGIVTMTGVIIGFLVGGKRESPPEKNGRNMQKTLIKYTKNLPVFG